MALRWGGGGGEKKTVAPKIPRVVCLNYQASNPESLSETPERLSEAKTRSGSAAKKRAAEVLTSCTNLTARLCMTVAKLLNLRGHLQEVK